MELKFLWENEKYWKLWNTFSEINKLSYTYSNNSHLYYLAYLDGKLVKDCSFVVIENAVAVAICPLFLIRKDNELQFSISGGYLHSWRISRTVNRKNYITIEKIIIKKIKELAIEYNVNIYLTYLNPLDKMSDKYYLNELYKYEFIEDNIATSIIDLSDEEDVLFQNISKGHKAAIKKDNKILEINIMDHSNPDKEIFDTYRLFHAECAGRVTRSIKTFDMNYKMLIDDEAILVYSKYFDKYCAFCFLAHINETIYYYSASKNSRLSTDYTQSHALIWKAIQYYKNRSFKFFEMGQQLYKPTYMINPSKKELDIALYKRCFGGYIMPLYRGRLYFNEFIAQKEIESNLKNYIQIYRKEDD